MDTNHELTAFNYTKSYYVTIRPRTGADVIDKGAYTFQFQLTDIAGVVRSTKTVTIEFVSTAAKSNATLALASNGTFLANTAIATFDTLTSDAYITATLRDARGGLVRLGNGSAPSVSVTLQEKTTAAPTFVDTPTSSLFTAADNGTLAEDLEPIRRHHLEMEQFEELTAFMAFVPQLLESFQLTQPQAGLIKSGQAMEVHSQLL